MSCGVHSTSTRLSNSLSLRDMLLLLLLLLNATNNLLLHVLLLLQTNINLLLTILLLWRVNLCILHPKIRWNTNTTKCASCIGVCKITSTSIVTTITHILINVKSNSSDELLLLRSILLTCKLLLLLNLLQLLRRHCLQLLCLTTTKLNLTNSTNQITYNLL